ncbi:DUF6907 domain-containing protein [Streptomyces sp. NPDC059165]|uniref:DUF6907 domain-containing protein n=1 Tax=Streptomyces sp. NPDC059165 TaxID=3346751 RepID=UPI0036A2F5C3
MTSRVVSDNDDGTVTLAVETLDQGEIVITCPTWCGLSMHWEPGHRIDITHTSDDVELTVPTSIGPAVLLRAVFEERPFTESAPGRDVFVNVELLDDWHPCDPAQLDALAVGMVECATRLRSIARRLAVLRGGA